MKIITTGCNCFLKVLFASVSDYRLPQIGAGEKLNVFPKWFLSATDAHLKFDESFEINFKSKPLKKLVVLSLKDISALVHW